MISILRLSLAGVFLIGLAACGKTDHGHAPAGGHEHTAPHGGMLVEIGEHAYTLELVREAAAGRLTAWALDGHAENFVRLKAASLELVATVGADKRPLPLLAVANSATGETVGDTSQFEAQADWLKTAASFEAVVTGMEIRGTKFETIAFRLSPAAK